MPIGGIYVLFQVAIGSGGSGLLLGGRAGFRSFWLGIGMGVAATTHPSTFSHLLTQNNFEVSL